MKVTIIGGTGSLGKALTARLYENCDITIFSRDEQKQFEMQKQFSKCRYILGDVRDVNALRRAISETTRVVFALQAQKHVPAGEANVEECVYTNILGNINVRDIVLEKQIPYCVFSSTDKAVDSLNVYGQCKAISERLYLNSCTDRTIFSVFKWGNILNSNGSVVPLFIDRIKNNKPVPITDIRMTRFFLKLPQAIDFMLATYETKSSEVRFPSCRSAKIVDVVDALGVLLQKRPVMVPIGIRPGEKLHEVLRSQHHFEGAISSDDPKNLMEQGELIELLREFIE